MNRRLTQAARATRAALRRIRRMVSVSDRLAVPRRPTVQPYPTYTTYTTRQATDPGEPDVALLAALMLGGLMDPATAAIIATLETDRRRDERRAH